MAKPDSVKRSPALLIRLALPEVCEDYFFVSAARLAMTAA